MKILQINSFFTAGGPPRIVNGIYDSLIEEGHACKIAAAREAQYVPQDSIQIGNRSSTYINALSCRLFDDDGFRSKHATHALVEEIKKYDPDIIHLHNLHSYYLNIEILFDYLKTSGKKIFWTLHDCWAFTGHCAYFSAAGCCKWETQCYNCPQKRSFPASFVHSNAKENFERKKRAFTGVRNLTIVTPSNWLAELVRKSYLGSYPVKVINNGIDLSKFCPTPSAFKEKYNLGNKKIVLGVAQVWGKRKGYYDFLKLADMLDSNYQVVLVGLSKEQRQALPQNILGFERTKSVEELVEIYSDAEVFVNLTYEDNFPTVNIEALACGTPIVTYNTGGSPEIADSENEIVCEQGDLFAVKNAIMASGSIIKNPERLIANAAKYSRQNMTNAYIQLYTSEMKI